MSKPIIFILLFYLLYSCNTNNESSNKTELDDKLETKSDNQLTIPSVENYYGIWYPLTINKATGDTLVDIVDKNIKWTKQRLDETTTMEEYPAKISKVEYINKKFHIHLLSDYSDDTIARVCFTPIDDNHGVWQRLDQFFDGEDRIYTRTPDRYNRAKSFSERLEEQYLKEELPKWQGEYQLELKDNTAQVFLYIKNKEFHFKIINNGKSKQYPVRFHFVNEVEIILEDNKGLQALISSPDSEVYYINIKGGNAGFLHDYIFKDEIEMKKIGAE